MNRNLLLAAAFGFLVVVVGVLLWLNFAAPSPIPARPAAAAPAARSTSPAPGEAGATPPVPPARRSTLTLYFEGPDLAVLFPEQREIDDVVDPSARARRVVEELIRGPEQELLATLPPGTRLHEVYLDNLGTAYVDFSHEVRTNHIGGSEGERMTVDSVVESLVRNVPEIQLVRFLVDGRPVETLAGHIDLTAPRGAGLAEVAGER